jgi:hypothetical protein
MAAPGSIPSPTPELPQAPEDTAPENHTEQPLSREELDALIEFFLLLDAWDNQKKIA